MSSTSLIKPNRTAAAATSTAASSSSRVSRGWSDLSSDLLVSIFSRLITPDLILGASSVCSSWRAAARDPHCWRILDISDWDSIIGRIHLPVSFSQLFNRVLGFVNNGHLIEEVYLPPDANGQDLMFVANRLPNLRYFSFPNDEIDEENIISALTIFKSLKGMAVNPLFFHILYINLPNLSELKLLSGEHGDNYFATIVKICKFFPKLRKLEIPSLHISTRATRMLLNSLQDLEYLDISGYNSSGISKEIIEKASRLKVFIWHSIYDLGEFLECNEEIHQKVGSTCQCMIEETVMKWLTETDT